MCGMVMLDIAAKDYQVLIFGANDVLQPTAEEAWTSATDSNRAGYNSAPSRSLGSGMTTNRVRSWGRSGLGVALALATWTALRPVSGPESFLGQDKVLHLSAYTGFYLLGRLGFVDPGWRLPAALFGYGLLIEGLQTLVPGRVPSGLDLAANALGLALGALLASGRWRGKVVAGDFGR